MEIYSLCVLDSLFHLPWKVANAQRSVSVWSPVSLTQPLSAGRTFSFCVQHFPFQMKYLKLREDGSFCLSSPSWPDTDLELECRSSGFQSRASVKVLKCAWKIPCPLKGVNLLWKNWATSHQAEADAFRLHSINCFLEFSCRRFWMPIEEQRLGLPPHGEAGSSHSHKHCIIHEEEEVNTTCISLWGGGPVILLLLLIFPINILSWNNKQKTAFTDYHLLFRGWAHTC